MSRPIADLSILSAPESYKWLLVRCHIGANTRAARLTRTALTDPDNRRACNEAVSWLAEEAFGDGESAVHAAEILKEVA